MWAKACFALSFILGIPKGRRSVELVFEILILLTGKLLPYNEKVNAISILLKETKDFMLSTPAVCLPLFSWLTLFTPLSFVAWEIISLFCNPTILLLSPAKLAWYIFRCNLDIFNFIVIQLILFHWILNLILSLQMGDRLFTLVIIYHESYVRYVGISLLLQKSISFLPDPTPMCHAVGTYFLSYQWRCREETHGISPFRSTYHWTHGHVLSADGSEKKQTKTRSFDPIYHTRFSEQQGASMHTICINEHKELLPCFYLTTADRIIQFLLSWVRIGL